MSKTYLLSSLAATLVLAVACGGGDKAQTPVSPSAADTVISGDAGTDGQTLKVPPPPHVAPANNATLEVFDPTLQVNAVQALYTNVTAFAYRFQILSGSTVIAEHRTASTSWKVDATLATNTTYNWRVRAEQGTFFGPWSAPWAFRTPDRPEGYIRGTEVFDPLNNGKTVGIAKNVTFIPNVGARIDSFDSRISYQLDSTLTAGEYSLLVTGMSYDTNGAKTKVMSMFNSNGDYPAADLTTSRWRMTVEKRGDDVGGDANFRLSWKYIAGNVNNVAEAGPSRRAFYPFDPNKTYLFTVQWGGGIRVEIREGGASGPVIYDAEEGLSGTYAPNPHWVHVGGTVPRAGVFDASVPGMIVKGVWVSSRPRPPFANQ